MDTRLLLLIVILSTAFIPPIDAVQCIQAYAGMGSSTPSTCTGAMCAITYLAGKLQVQSCINNVGMIIGCLGNTTNRVVCTCNDKDMCNSDPFNVTSKMDMPSSLFDLQVSCPEQNPTGLCDSPTCMYANDTNRNICRNFNQPTRFYYLYPNAVFIDQSLKLDNNSLAVPTYSHLGFCTVKVCADNYNNGNYTRAHAPIACYTNSDTNPNANQLCYGQVCYVNSFNGSTTRGCVDYVFDTLWAQGYTQIFERITNDRLNGTKRYTLYQFVQLEYYFCNYDNCNFDTVSNYKLNGPRNSTVLPTSSTISSGTATTTKASSSFPTTPPSTTALATTLTSTATTVASITSSTSISPITSTTIAPPTTKDACDLSLLHAVIIAMATLVKTW